MDKNKNISKIISDPTFLNWLNQSNEADVVKWEKWKRESPENETLLEDARMMVQGFSFKKNPVLESQTEKSWDQLASILNAPEAPQKRIALPRRLLQAAAVLVLLIGAGWVFLQWGNTAELLVFQTGPNETRSIDLPDGSSLLLNTNSKIQYSSDWLAQDLRQLELQGEAYFQIQAQAKGKTVRVQTPALKVQVIGTAFNVNAKRINPIVSLVEGQVELLKSTIPSITLQAGQTAWFDQQNQQFKIETDQTNYWKNWTLQKWTFGEGTPVREVLQRIEETYGLTYKVNDPKILEKVASGEVSIESKAVLFEALSFLLEVEIEEQNNQLLISPMK